MILGGADIIIFGLFTGVISINGLYLWLLIKDCKKREELNDDILKKVIYPVHFK